MRIIETFTRACLISLTLVLPLSGCLYNVGSLFGYNYPIQDDGSVDMSLAPDDDIVHLALTGFYHPGKKPYSTSVACESAGSAPAGTYETIYSNPATFSTTLYNAGGSDFFTGFSAIQSGKCRFIHDSSDDTYVVNLAVKVGPFYTPILSETNLRCIEENVRVLHLNEVRATMECLATDSRYPSNPLGLSTGVEEINVLKLKVSSDFFMNYLTRY